MAVVEVHGLSKRYGSVQALRSVDVAVERGCTGLVGSNGAGKSTLLKLLLGLIVPDWGRATVLGHDVATDPLGVRSGVGYLPEGACLPGDVTAADFVAFMGQLGGLPPRAARERASEVCYQVGLDEERYRALSGFSTGMLQRVKLAVALVHDPRLLLLAGNVLTADSAMTYLGDHLGDLPRILLAGGVLTVYYAVISLAIASLTERRGIAVAVQLGVLLASGTVAGIVFFAARFGGRRWVSLLALQQLPERFVDWVFGEPFQQGSMAAEAGFTGPVYLVAMGVVSALAFALLVWRISRLRA